MPPEFEAETPATTGSAPRGSAEPEMAARAPKYSLRRLLRGSSLYSLSEITLKSLGFFLIPLYTRALTPTDYGIVGFATAVIQILSPLIGLSLIGSVSILFYAYDGEERRRLISTIVNFMLLTGLVTTLGLSLFSEPMFSSIASDIPFDPFILLALLTTYVTTMQFLPLKIFNMRDKPGTYAIYAISLGLVGVAINVVLVIVLGLGAKGALMAGLAAGIIGMIAAGFVVKPYWRPVMERAKLRETLALALPALPNQFAGTLGRFADRLFLASSTTLAITGVYSLAVTFSTIALMVLGGITTALTPLFYRRAYAEDSTLRRDWARLASLFLFVAAMVGLALSLVGADLIRLLTPASYHGATGVLPLLVLAQVLFAVYWFFSPTIGYRRKMWAYPVASFSATGVNLVLNAILVPRIGGDGAALSLLAMATVQLVIFGSLAQHFYPIQYEKRRILILVLITAVAFLAGYAAPSDPLAISLAAKSAAILAVPLFLRVLGFFDPGELESARRVVRGIATTLRSPLRERHT